MIARPHGAAAGSAGFVLAWFGGLAVARLTGATPVVIVLVAGVASAVVAAVGGWWALRGVAVTAATLPAETTVGDPVPLSLATRGADRPVWLDVAHRHDQGHHDRCLAPVVMVGGGWAGCGPLELRFGRRGEVGELVVTARAAGALGLVWWRRTFRAAIDPLVVAPRAEPRPVRIDHTVVARDGETRGTRGPTSGDTDGVRPWREGDSERSVHWPTTLRAGALVVHDRSRLSDRRTVVRAAADTGEPDTEAGAALAALHAALAAGDETWAAVGAGEPAHIADLSAARRWAATAELGASAPEPAAPIQQRIEQRLVAWLRRRVEPDAAPSIAARWWAAGATLLALLMMAGSLGYGVWIQVLAAAGVLLGAAVSARTLARGSGLGTAVRAVVAAGALVSIAAIAAGAGRLEGLLAVLRGPLPQLLIVLIVLHGFECRDRRTVRVGLAISAVVVMYAAAFRVDRTLGLWLAGWAVAFGLSLRTLQPRPGRRAAAGGESQPGRAIGRAALASVGTALLAILALAAVPVPQGPTRLTLPTFIGEQAPVGQPGALAGSDGRVRAPAEATGDAPPRHVAAGDYAGFAETLDTNVRGELSDDVVLRVRADRPDFWRGQTFAEFDGRMWHADQRSGQPIGGGHVDVPPAFGDPQGRAGARGGRYSLEPEQFTQTYFVETDLPNVLFHAYQPDEVVIDAEVWARPDGALRASTVLPAGSVYTVVSERRPVTADWLRGSGMVGERLNPLGLEAFAEYLAVPASTTPQTRTLASELAEGLNSTYDIVRAYERWIDANVTYDLDAPLPDDGEDAVDELLFGSRRGFCEQIASALVVMLRTQGVPARLATGYTPGRRDAVAGVWEVRASDAHAWAEVWFPEVGWQAFDPTAGVPLAGDAEPATIGAGVARAAAGWVSDRPEVVALTAAVGLAAAAAWLVTRALVRRRRRGRWGRLQDRFAALGRAAGDGAREGASNGERAAAWPDAAGAAIAREVAARLDAAAFDPAWDDDDEQYAQTRKLVESLH